MSEPKPQEGPAGGSNMLPVVAALVLIPLVAVVLFVMLSDGGGGADPNAITTESGLKYVDIQVGTGKVARLGDSVTVHYTGRLKNGTKFDSSHDRREPFSFDLGKGEVIKGWDEGVVGMKEGGKRKLIIPSHLAYGERGAGKTIPPGAELTFDIELLRVK